MKSKIVKIIFSVIIAFSLASCDKENLADNYEVVNTLPPYVELKSLSNISVKQGANATFGFQVRSGLQQTTTITYSITGVINAPNRTVVLNRNILSVDVSLPIPLTTPVGTATVTLISAVTADGKALTIGAKNISTEQKVNINITAP
ncbi:hypothetical protein PBAC_27970 [Pedobacter glucosidilyticus]|nr:hypothetical protein [Pedobacter glucosidilyticus]KHJ37021.1 hypothetical protein PBAC_27970 [Pedobacter glucosidilyticus]